MLRKGGGTKPDEGKAMAIWDFWADVELSCVEQAHLDVRNPRHWSCPFYTSESVLGNGKARWLVTATRWTYLASIYLLLFVSDAVPSGQAILFRGNNRA